MSRRRISNAGRCHDKVYPNCVEKEEEKERKENKKREGAAGVASKNNKSFNYRNSSNITLLTTSLNRQSLSIYGAFITS